MLAQHFKKGGNDSAPSQCCNLTHIYPNCVYINVSLLINPLQQHTFGSHIRRNEPIIQHLLYIRRFNKKEHSNSSNTLFKLYFQSMKSLRATIGHFIFHSW